MNSDKHEPCAPDTIDFQIDHVLKASPEDPLTDQDEQFLQQVYETYLPGNIYDLSLRRVRQRLETRLANSTGEWVALRQASSEPTRRLARPPQIDPRWRRSLNSLAAAILCLLLSG